MNREISQKWKLTEGIVGVDLGDDSSLNHKRRLIR